MALAVPLSAEQIERAGRLRDHLTGWVDSEGALCKLAERFPEFDGDACLLKVVTIDSLYGTNVYAIMRMAKHVQKVLSRCELATAGPELVEELAALPAPGSKGKVRRCRSFASKFAHFFIHSDRFPIMDKYATQMVKLHLERACRPDGERPYMAFVTNLAKLKKLVPWEGSSRELDHYLWLAGQYRAWKRNPDVPINAETKRLFSTPPPGLRAELDGLVPPILDKAFKGEL